MWHLGELPTAQLPVSQLPAMDFGACPGANIDSPAPGHGLFICPNRPSMAGQKSQEATTPPTQALQQGYNMGVPGLAPL